MTVLDVPVAPPAARPSSLPGVRAVDAALLLGVPVAWAALLLFHPTGEGDLVFPILSDQLTKWQFVHVGMVLFIPLMVLAARRLTMGIDNVAARVSRVSLPIGAVVYGVYEAMVGIGTGALAGHVGDLPQAEQATGAALVESFMRSSIFRVFEYGGSLALATGIIAAAFALHRARSVKRGAVVLFVLAAPLITMHVPPFGPVGLAFFVIAVILVRHALGRVPTRPSPRPAQQ